MCQERLIAKVNIVNNKTVDHTGLQFNIALGG